MGPYRPFLGGALSLLLASLLVPGCGGLSRSTSAADRPAAAAPDRPVGEGPRASLAHLPARDDPGIVDRVVAVVNNDVITLSELQDGVAYYLYESKEPVKPGQMEALKERLLGRMIDHRLQLQEAARAQIGVDDAEVAELLATAMKRVNVGTEAELEKAVAAQGLTLEGVKRRLREQLMVQKVVRRKVGFRVSVTEEEIEKYLLDNRDKLETGLSYRARHILLTPKPPRDEAAWEAARTLAEEVWQKILEGEEFSELAQRYSEDPSAEDGGDLGVLKQGEVAPDLEGQILRLSPGEAGAPFRSRLGFHIFQLESKESLSDEALRQAKGQIREILFRQKYAARLDAWLAEIKKRAVIEVRM